IDRRAPTPHVRDGGAQEGIVSTDDLEPARLAERARALPPLVGRDLVREVTADAPYTWREGVWHPAGGYSQATPARFRVVAYDSGIKFNILRQLASAGCDLTVVPARTPAARARELRPHGVFLANGPGAAEAVPSLIAAGRALLGHIPILGTCFAHQILALAAAG